MRSGLGFHSNLRPRTPLGCRATIALRKTHKGAPALRPRFPSDQRSTNGKGRPTRNPYQKKRSALAVGQRQPPTGTGFARRWVALTQPRTLALVTYTARRQLNRQRRWTNSAGRCGGALACRLTPNPVVVVDPGRCRQCPDPLPGRAAACWPSIPCAARARPPCPEPCPAGPFLLVAC